jgi:FkbM family methyltransferase
VVVFSPPNLLNHRAFTGVEPQWTKSPAGFFVTGIGQICSLKHDSSIKNDSSIKEAEYMPILPWGWLHEEIFEWIALGEAVHTARNTFTMIELGAGYDRWIVAAELFARRVRPELKTRLIGVEAESTHYKWMIEHFQHNNIDPSKHTLIEAAVAAEDREMIFVESDDPSADYGQHVSFDYWDDQTRARNRVVEAVSLKTLLSDLDTVDLVDSDIQGFERYVVPASIEAMTEKVKRAFISTHEPIEIEAEVSAAFKKYGWELLNSASANSVTQTEFGEITNGDGHQYWINPKF